MVFVGLCLFCDSWVCLEFLLFVDVACWYDALEQVFYWRLKTVEKVFISWIWDVLSVKNVKQFWDFTLCVVCRILLVLTLGLQHVWEKTAFAVIYISYSFSVVLTFDEFSTFRGEPSEDSFIIKPKVSNSGHKMFG